MTSIAFSPRGDSLAVAREARGVTIQGLSSERDLGATSGGDRVTSLAYSPDGSLLAVVSEDGRISLWDADTLQVSATIDGRGPVSGLAFSPDGRVILGGRIDGSAALWDVASGAEIVRFDGGVGGGSRGADGQRVRHSDRVVGVAFSPDGSLAATGSVDKTIGIWDVGRRSPAAVGFLAGHTATVNSVQFSPNGQEIISASEDGTVRLWSLVGQREQLRLEAHTNGALGAFFLPGSGQSQAVSAGIDDTIRMWQLIDGREARRSYAPGSADSVALSADGDLALVASPEGVISIDMAGGAELQRLAVANPAMPAVAALTPDGNLAAVGGADGRITLWNPRSGEAAGELSRHTGAITALAFDPTGTRLASGSYDETLLIWDVADSEPAQTVVLRDPADSTIPVRLLAAAWSPDGTRLLLGTSEGAWIWDVAAGEAIHEGDWPHSPTLAVAWSPDGAMAAVGGADREVSVLDAGGSLLYIFAHRGPVRGVAFTADGSRVVSSATDRRIALWSLGDESEVQHIDVTDGSISSLAIDGATDAILTGSDDGAVRVWRFDELGALPDWIAANRHVPELTDEMRQDLGIE